MKRFLTAIGWITVAFATSTCSKKDLPFANSRDAASYNRPVGAAAKDLLNSNTFSSLLVEVQYISGYAPDPAALDQLQQFLASRTNKPGGITITTRAIEDPGSTTLSLSQIRELENRNRTAFNNNTRLSLYILYSNSDYTDAGTLGIAYRNTSAALMGKKIHENSGSFGQVSRTKLEATVLEHEVGHLLGLVDLGSPMQSAHKDASHGNHCKDNQCLMFYASETTDVFGFLSRTNPPALDAGCLADLKANGGK
ncbi:M12 family metallo-peptidase [Niabella drilacis]|uniref:Metallo-peptidase family M12 n=1 Tax=Niabella drilacis (strain DSM 25811 / CCM 8410 / CCUG 62505 / LMG 26954 / E90) TaxID=1285928 RepID=A0A1G7AJV3_NIADE|nr:M12 family metallo-peptidase [Niabella drilacis]SDE14747.1 Metallo-peptidase family M12 [Niabella drilacis]